MSISLRKENEEMIRTLVRSGRRPHTVIIEGDSKEERDGAALMLAASAVCTSPDKPCLSCNPCRKVLEGQHPDLIIPEPSKRLKSGIISLSELRDEYLSQVSIKPNEADTKIYLFYDADRLLREDSQNTLLKIIEEPPQDILFIFTVEKAKALLSTVRSRAHILTLSRTEAVDEESDTIAEQIADGIVKLYEYDLLMTLSSLTKKEQIEAVLAAFTEKLRLALNFQSGVMTDDPCAKKIARKLNREKLIAVIEVTLSTIAKLKTNVNLQLLMTWLCTQYRRITWQK
ncbi:MAG: hypothetical protein IJS27_04375 [Ruminococcus sp.]|nr:hypothetical protein [Ruminococcus sp.]MBQ9516350.1 hypothetical protein [Ruminococcus sp.]